MRHATRRRIAAGSFLAALALTAARAANPQPPAPQASPTPPTFPAEVELVTVDVVVSDGKGVPVTGLSREDFVLEEDGRRQAIESFEAFDTPPRTAALASRPSRVSSNAGAGALRGRTYVLVFDDVNLTPFLAQRAKVALADFLKSGTRAGDRVMLVATSGEVWWSADASEGPAELVAILKRLEGRSHPNTAPDRITPWEAMRIHLYHDREVGDRVARRLETYGATLPAGSSVGAPRDGSAFTYENPQVMMRAQQVYQEATTRNRLTLNALELALESLAAGRGRKAVVFVSEGFIYDPNLDEFKRVLEASRRANAALYFVDARGLEGLPLAASAEFGQALEPRDLGMAFLEGLEASEGAELLASDSGGFSVKNTNDLAKGLRRVSAEAEAYYLLGYRSDNKARDGRFRKVRVEARRRGAQVRARAGYYAPADGQKTAFDKEREGKDGQLEAALNSPFDEAAVPLRAGAFAFDETLLGKTKVVVAAEVDVRGLSLQESEGRLVDELETLVVVSHRESGEHFRHDRKLELKLLPGALGSMGRDWYALTQELDLAPGRHQARIVVRDKNGGRVGSVTHSFEVGAPGTFRISTPVLGDTLHQGEGSGPHPVMVLRRSFRGDGVLYCEYQVYGAGRENGGGAPRVSAGFEVRRADGTSVMRVEPTPMRPTSLGKLSRIVVAPLRGAAPGDYELVLQLRDEVAGQALEAREPFSVEGE
jgi:VWFA-related protein